MLRTELWSDNAELRASAKQLWAAMLKLKVRVATATNRSTNLLPTSSSDTCAAACWNACTSSTPLPHAHDSYLSCFVWSVFCSAIRSPHYRSCPCFLLPAQLGAMSELLIYTSAKLKPGKTKTMSARDFKVRQSRSSPFLLVDAAALLCCRP
jgi:urease accessory protein UreF